MTTITSATAPASRRAILIGTTEVTFTPYVTRKVGEVREVEIDGNVQKVIYNERRNLTYLVLNIDGVQTTGRIAAELEDGGQYGSCKKSVRVAPPAGKKVTAKAPVAAPAKMDETNEVLKVILGAIDSPKAQPAKKARKPKAVAA